jgi:hypothetical protein
VITFEELAQKYPVQSVAPYGACVVVPGVEFDPDWEVYLGDHGCRVIMTDLDGRPVTLVQRKSAGGESVRDVYALEESGGDKKSMEKVERTKSLHARAKGGNLWLKVWSVEEDEFLIGLWNRKPKLTVAKITVEFCARFPDRSPGAVGNRVSALQVEGRIQPRFKTKRKGTKAPENEDEKLETEEPYEKKALSEAYEALSKAYVELKTDFKKLEARVDELAGVCTYIPELQANLIKHKHAVGSGEAMLPMEAVA